jgi:uncharacterized repeat protein (TIGR02543 family)
MKSTPFFFIIAIFFILALCGCNNIFMEELLRRQAIEPEIPPDITWVVTFESNGGSLITGQIVGDGGTANRPIEPTRTSYTFNNWYRDSGLTVVYDFKTPVTADITLYARWDIIPAIVDLTGVALNKNTMTLTVGASETLIATFTPGDATNKNVTWSTNNNAVATVSTSGLVTAVSPGNATITVIASDGSHTATCSVTVNPVAVTGVTLSQTTLSLIEGGAATLIATIAPANATNKNVTWSTSNPAVATVAGGVVTAIGAGTANIIVTTADGSLTATCAVTVVTASNKAVITITIDQIENEDEAITISGGTTISLSGAIKTLTLNAPTGYTSYEWKIDGVGAFAGEPITGTGNTFTVEATNIKYNSIGTHTVYLVVLKGAVRYSKTILITIDP